MRMLSVALALSTALAFAGGEDTGLIPKAQRKDASAFGFTDGKNMKTLAEYHGKIVVVDFWTTWCPPCRASLPEVAHLQRQEGKVAWSWSGYGEGYMSERLKVLLKELPPPPPRTTP